MTLHPLPVIVDLDGTLTPVDTLHELAIASINKAPAPAILTLVRLPFNKPLQKRHLAALAPDYPASLPWSSSVAVWLESNRSEQVILCTASAQEVALRVASLHGGFSEALGSDGATNLKGPSKADRLVSRFGRRGFSYVGNSWADVPVWSAAARAVVVSNDQELIAKAREVCPYVEVLAPEPRNRWVDFVRALRPHQWVKNLLVFLPFLASHSFERGDLLLSTVVAFAVFCLLASASYLVNDLLDLHADRLHPVKRLRPIAAGALDALAAAGMSAMLASAALAFAAVQSPALLMVALAYLFLATAYSRWLKRIAFLDVGLLAGLYTSRLWAGSAATEIWPSPWLSGFSLALFVSLALCKRFVEYRRLGSAGETNPSRGYTTVQLSAIRRIGIFAHFSAVGVLAAYLSSQNVVELYGRPLMLVPAPLVVAFWGFRVWRLAAQGRVDEDPVIFALRDRVSWLCLGALASIFIAALG
ncbi:MAG: UbiA family prenyltransferase [Opitutaceae bacterium]|nr:UbiA family prenyltransferase [Opitutaceae bacterium]